jgi:predicted nucleotidyltransferase
MQLRLEAIPPWLDSETSALVRDKVEVMVRWHPDLIAMLLYGSVARHEERPLDDLDPSDVDLLIVFDTEDANSVVHRYSSFFATLSIAEDKHRKAPREVNVMFTTRTAHEWDEDFVENVRRDAIVLYQRDELPKAFAA